MVDATVQEIKNHYASLSDRIQRQIEEVEKWMLLIEEYKDIVHIFSQTDSALLLQCTFSREALDAITPYVQTIKIFPERTMLGGRVVILVMIPTITNGVQLFEICRLQKEESK